MIKCHFGSAILGEDRVCKISIKYSIFSVGISSICSVLEFIMVRCELHFKKNIMLFTYIKYPDQGLR